MMATDKPKLYADTVAPVYRTNSDELFLLIIEAKPEPDSEDFGKAGGAFVCCWVNADDLRSAEIRAVALIEEHCWWPYRFESWEFVSRETYADRDLTEDENAESLESFEQALLEGEACLFSIWPIDAPDA